MRRAIVGAAVAALAGASQPAGDALAGRDARALQAVTCRNLPSTLAGSLNDTTVGSVVPGFGGSCSGVTFEALGSDLLLYTVPAGAPPGGVLTVSTCGGATWDTEIVVSLPLAGGRCPANSSFFTCGAANDDGCGVQSIVTIPTAPSNTHAILVSGYGASVGNYTVSWSYAPPSSSRSATATVTPNIPSRSPNATFVPPRCESILAPALSGSVFGTTVGGSVGFGGSCGGVSYSAANGEDLILITVPASATPGGVLTLDTCSQLTTFDTEIVVAAAPGGVCPASQGAFNCLAANDDACGVGSRVSLPWAPGATAAVLVSGYGTNSGNYSLSWSYTIPSPTRTPGAAPSCQSATGVSGSFVGTTAGAVASNKSGSCTGVGYSTIGGENVVLLTVPASAPGPRGTLIIDTCNIVGGSAWDTELIVSAPLAGGLCPTAATGFSCLTANDDAASCGTGLQSRVAIQATPGTTYGVLVTGYNLEAGAYNLSWSYGVPTPTPSMTPSKTPNFVPQCFSTNFASGTFSGTTADGSGGVGFGGTCAGVSFSALLGEDLLLINIPATALPNGILTLDTCECGLVT